VLLTLLFFAAAMAFALVVALPRSAMQSQRVREETLIYRGEQYKRAVQLYFRKYKKYPESLDDLEESDGIRFLRRRYKDPLTGEDEWRLVRMGSDGRFKDSLLFDQEEEGTAGVRAGGMQPNALRSAVSAATRAFQPAVGTFRGADRARATRESASPDIPGQFSNADYMAAGLGGQVPPDGVPAGDLEAQGQGQPGGAVPYPNYARTLPSQIPSPTGAGAPPNPAVAVNPYPGVPGAYPGQPTPAPNQQSSNRLGARGRGARGVNQPGMVAAAPQPGAQANVPPPGFGAAGVGGSAADLIRNLLTTPRPNGLAGLRAAQGAAQQNRPNFSEGIAGVASKVEERGIKVYNDHEFYNEWEFVYDYRQDATMAGIPGVGPQQGAVGNLNPNQPGLGPGGTLQVDPSQTVPVPGAAGVPGVLPGTGQPAGTDPFQQPPAAPPAPGVSPYDPATGIPPYGQQPGQPGTTPYIPADRNSRRRRGSPPPLPGLPIYPGAGQSPNQPILTPGQPFEVPGEPPVDPNQLPPSGQEQ